MRPAVLLLGLVPIIIWSASATILVAVFRTERVGDLLAGMFFFAGLTSLVVVERWYRPHVAVMVRDPVAIALTVGVALFVVLHYGCLYYAFETEAVVEANAINYLWPIVLYFLVRGATDRRKSENLMAEGLLYGTAFTGAALVVIFNTVHGGATVEVSYENLLSTPFVLAISSAISAAAYMALNRRAAARFPVELRDGSVGAVLHGAIVLTLVVSVPTTLFSDFTGRVTMFGVAAFVYVGTINVVLSNLLWARALLLDKAAMLPALAFLVPVLSTFLLVTVHADLTINIFVIAGLILIVTANVLLQSEASVFSTYRGGVVVAAIVAGVMVVLPSASEAPNSFVVAATLTTFVFYCGFVLNRLAARDREQDAAYADVSRRISELAAACGAGKDEQFDRLLARLSSFQRSGPQRAPRVAASITGELEELTRGEQAEAVEESCQGMRNALAHWLVVKQQLLSNAEKFVLLVLGMTSFSSIVLYRGQGVWSDVSGIAVGSCIVFLVFHILQANVHREHSWQRDAALRIAIRRQEEYRPPPRASYGGVALDVLAACALLGVFLALFTKWFPDLELFR